MLPHTTKIRTTGKFKNIKQPELLENRTVWKSDNQGVKEETFTQTGMRDADRQLGRRGCEARQQLVVPHLHEDKLGGTTGEQDTPCNPGFQHREIKPQNL